MNNEKPKESSFHVTDLASYAKALTAFKTYLAEQVRSKEDAERLLKEFDEKQKELWSDHATDKNQ